MPYTIYLRTNLVNGKQYVGQTNDIERRNKNWNTLSVRYANKFLEADRDKYGLTNFKTEILAEAIEKNRQSHIGMVSKKRKGIIQLTLDGEFVQEFSHCKDAANIFGLKSSESIRKACIKPNRTSCGFKWMYKEEFDRLQYEKMLGG